MDNPGNNAATLGDLESSSRPEGTGDRIGGLLSILSLVLWVAAVGLGLSNALLGLGIHAEIIVGLVLASGLSSLLALPLSASPPCGQKVQR
ncbi:MAG: hypothetical protein MUF57_07710 [Gammaproteobacteria bacterium]|jgi:hypothetical protein|nr:hypothetical protein [Gammaproteobacteria bacterium]